MKKYLKYVICTFACRFDLRFKFEKAKLHWITYSFSKNTSSKITISNSILSHCGFSVNGKGNIVNIHDGANMYYSNFQIDGNDNYINLNSCSGIMNLTLRGDNCLVTIGKETSMEGVYMICMGKENIISIGNNCMFSGDIELWNTDSHLITDIDGKQLNPSLPIKIGNHVWVGKHVRILKGVTIGDNSIIGMNAVVTHDVPANSIVVGNPAKVVKSGVTWHHGFIEI